MDAVTVTLKLPRWAVQRLEAEALASGRSRHHVARVALLAYAAELPEPTCTPEA
jgi:hypothetical protein